MSPILPEYEGAETPVSVGTAVPQQAQKPTRRTVLDYEDLQSKLVSAMAEAHRQAIIINLPRKRKFNKYRRLRDGFGVGDNVDDRLTQLGVYVPIIARLIDVAKAIVMASLVPDPGSMDFIQAEAQYSGLEEIVEKITSLMRHNFRRMRPDEAPGGFYELMGQLVDDLFTYGTSISICNYTYQVDDDSRVYNDVATAQWVDPANFWPLQIDTARPTGATIWAPLSIDDLPDLKIPQDIAEKLNDLTWSKDLPARDLDAKYFDYTEPYYDDTSQEMEVEDFIRVGHPMMLPRRRYLGDWPTTWINHAFGKDDAPDKLDIINALAEKFSKAEEDPEGTAKQNWVAKALTAQHWIFEWCQDVLIRAEPFPISLPPGFEPYEISHCFKRSGRFWGFGFYDRGMWDERIMNFYNRVMISIGAMMAEPPYKLNIQALDRTWMQENGQKLPRLVGGMAIPINGDITGKEWEFFTPSEQYLPAIGGQFARHMDSIRQLTGVHEETEGQGNAKTATQGQMNLAQSLTSLQHLTEQLRQGLLRRILQRCYMIKRQAMRIKDVGEVVASCEADAQLRTLTVKPEDMMDMSYVDFICVGATSPGGPKMQLEGLAQWLQLWMPTGGVSIPDAMRIHAKMLKIPMPESLIMQWRPEEIQRMMVNVMQMAGPQGVTMLPASVQQQVTQMTGGMVPLLPGAGQGQGGGGIPPAAGTPSLSGPGGLSPMMGVSSPMQQSQEMSGKRPYPNNPGPSPTGGPGNLP